jgi:hypothetical protein
MAGSIFKLYHPTVAISAASHTAWKIGLLQIAATLIVGTLAIHFGSIRTEPGESHSQNLAHNEGQSARVSESRPIATPSPVPGPRPRGDTGLRRKSPRARTPSGIELLPDSGPGLPGIVRECSYTDLQLRQCPAPSASNSANSKSSKKGVS